MMEMLTGIKGLCEMVPPTATGSPQARGTKAAGNDEDISQMGEESLH